MEPAPPTEAHRVALPNDHEAVASDRLATVLGWCIGIAAGAAVLAVGMYVHTFGWHLSANHEVWNQAGGYFGGVLGPAFGFLSLFALLFTVMLQREMLSLGRRQLADANEGLAVSRAAYERQQFESTFFELLKLSRELLDRFEFHGTSTVERSGPSQVPAVKRGPAALDAFAARVDVRASQQGANKAERSTTAAARILVHAYGDIYRGQPSAFGPYLRVLYQTFKHIAESSLAPPDQVRYSNIARGQMSEGAVFLLALNGLTAIGSNFVRYIEGYGLLEHMHGTYRTVYGQALLEGYRERAFLGSKARATIPMSDIAQHPPDYFERPIGEPGPAIDCGPDDGMAR